MKRIRYDFVRPVAHLLFLLIAFSFASPSFGTALPSMEEDVLRPLFTFTGVYLSLLTIEAVAEYIKLGFGAVLLGSLVSFASAFIPCLVIASTMALYAASIGSAFSNGATIILPIYLVIEFLVRRYFPPINANDNQDTV